MSASISIQLIPSVIKDEETELFSAKFKEFPVAIVFDETKEKAESRLISVFEALVENERTYIIETVNKNYNTSFDINTAIIELHKSVKFKDHHKEQEMQLTLPELV